MKKVLPLLLFVLLAFAGCQRTPATYQMANNPKEMVANAEKFAKQVSKDSKHYSAEDWQVIEQQFVIMGKNYVENMQHMTEEERMRYDHARMDFMYAVGKNGGEELTARIKADYANIID